MMRRRDFLRATTAGLGAASVGLRTFRAEAQAPPETTRLRLNASVGALCNAPQFVAEDLLRAEGFTDLQYVKLQGPPLATIGKALASGEIDLTMTYATNTILQLDAGDPVVLLAGVHVGCYELFGTGGVRAVRDLRGRKVAVPELGSSHHTFVSMMAAHVGLDPRKDIEWIIEPGPDAKRRLAEGTVDALMAFPPDPQELRAKKIGRVIVSSAVDRPWSQYLCCMVTGNREFVRKHPVATKRAIRAYLKAADVCATDPDRAARMLVDRGTTPSYDTARQTLKDLPYDRWRQLDPTDTVRFWSLRLHEAGLIKTGPNKIVAQGTDWRLFNELKKELKG